MSGPNAATLARMRATHQRFMPETWTLVRPTYGSDGQGGQTETGTTTIASGNAAAGTGARIAPARLSANEGQLAERLGSVDIWHITLPYGTDARITDRVLSSGRTFDVAKVEGPHSFASALRLLTVEIT